MLVIRQGQMTVLSAAARSGFLRSTVDLFAARFPDLAADRDAFEARVNAAVERARGYGFRQQDHILQLVELDLLRGSRWELEPESEWALGILNEPEVDPSSRLYRLMKRIGRMNEHAG